MTKLSDKQPTIGEVITYADLPVTITHSQPAPRVAVEETCATCRHWDYLTDWVQDRDEPHDGTCRLITADARNKAAIYAPASRDKPQLWTEADFACNQWQRRADGGE